MSILTQIGITINGTTFNKVVDLKLKENVGKHTDFSVTVRGDAAESQLTGVSLLESSRNFLGKSCILEIQNHENVDSPTLTFKGIVTHVRGKKGNDFTGIGDLIELKGKSISLLLDNGKHANAFLEQSLSEIVDTVLTDYISGELKTTVQPSNDPILAYSVQHQQSAFEFLQHLAATQGEYLLYARDTLYFGAPNLGDTVSLNYGLDLKDFSLGLATKPLNFTYFANDYFADAHVESLSSAAASVAQGNSAFVSNASNELFTTTPQQAFPTYEDAQLQQRVDTAVALQKKLSEQQQVILYGESNNTGVSLGMQVNITNDEGSFGTFRVTKVTHTYQMAGTYLNVFEAVPIEIDVYPLTNTLKITKADTQIAVVKDTTDPEGMSRIKVQYPWQKATGGTTPWLRVSTPFAGEDQGFHFIPELGESVLIGYENGNIERPYVQAALYTGAKKPTEWQTDANNVKAIRTRSGHTIELNDTEGEEKINIYDNEGSIITFDTQAKSLTIQTAETLDINAKNINMIATENINIQAEGNIGSAAKGDVTIQSQGATNIQATGDASLASSGAVSIEATSDATLSGANAVVSGQASAELSGAQAKVAGSGITEVSGGLVKVN